MMGSGRPLRFMVGLIGLWVGARILVLWPVDDAVAAEAASPSAPLVAALAWINPAAPKKDLTPAVVRDAHASRARPVRAMRDTDTPHVPEPVRYVATTVDPVISTGFSGAGRRSGETLAVAKAIPSAPMPPPALEPRRDDLDRTTPVLAQTLAPTSFTPLHPEPSSPAALPPVHSPFAAPPVVQSSRPPGVPLPPPVPKPSRFAGSAWLIARRGGAVPFAPQLGGSQAGARLTYALDPARRLSLAGRISTALASRQTEAAIGLDWKPTALPVHVIAEQRIGIDRARGGPSLGLVGGFGPTPLIGPWQLDGYGQGGAIVRDGVEGYADGALRLSYPFAMVGRTRFELGLGLWGAAQRGAARLDAGPAAAAIVPIAGRSFRLSLEWRQRLAGRATPASGPALSIGTDF